MTQTLDGILKTKFLTNSGIPASRAFTQTVADLLPENASIADTIHLAQAIYLQATNVASVLPNYAVHNSAIPLYIRGFSDPWARQSVSDFSYMIREVIASSPKLQDEYDAFRSTAVLHEAFATYLPQPKPENKDRLVAA